MNWAGFEVGRSGIALTSNVGTFQTNSGPIPVPHPSSFCGHTLLPQAAEPNHVCGLPAQHQPSFGLPPLIHKAVTLRSPQREPGNEKPPFLIKISG